MAAPGADTALAGLQYFETGEYADMELVICIRASESEDSGSDGEDAAPESDAADEARAAEEKQPARVLHTVAAHRVVLAVQSAWAKAMLSNVQAPQGAKPRLELAVDDEEEGEGTQLLVRVLYAAGDPCAPLKGQPQATLLRVLRLADRLQAPLAVAAAVQMLAGVAPALEWDTALGIWELPDGCAKHPAYTAAFEAATKTAQARLGDLDAALADSDSRNALLEQLPLDVLVSLLRSEETRASSENVVFFVCCEWLCACDDGSKEQTSALAACLRLHRMRPLYLTTVVGSCSWVPREAVLLAAGFISADSAVKAEMMKKRDAELQARERPASRLTQGAIEWALPLSKLSALHEEAAALGVGGAARKHSTWAAWGGFDWRLELQAMCKEGGVQMGLYVLPYKPQGCGATGVAAADIALACGSVSFSCRPMVFAHKDGMKSMGWVDFFGLGERAAWDEGAWRAKGVVGDGDVLKFKATIGRPA